MKRKTDGADASDAENPREGGPEQPGPGQSGTCHPSHSQECQCLEPRISKSDECYSKHHTDGPKRRLISRFEECKDFPKEFHDSIDPLENILVQHPMRKRKVTFQHSPRFSKSDECYSTHYTDGPKRRLKSKDLPKEFHESTDLLEKILVQQPMRRLAELMMVSRQWKTLIGQPTFQHIVVSKSEASNIFVSYLHTLYKLGILQVTSENKYSVSNFNILPPNNVGPLPLRNILGSSNGLVCLRNSDTGGNRVEKDILLLNPRTRKMKLIKDVKHCGREKSNYGLGYDTKLRDFKIVKMCPPYDLANQGEVIPQKRRASEMIHMVIYSWKQGSWREKYVEDWQFKLADRSAGIYFEGKLYSPGKVWKMDHWLFSFGE